jgi:hypothetical protein
MPTIDFNFSLEQTLGPGQTREFNQGGYVSDGNFSGVFVCPRAQLGHSISLLGTTVMADTNAQPFIRYTVRNNNLTQSVPFRRISVRIKP